MNYPSVNTSGNSGDIILTTNGKTGIGITTSPTNDLSLGGAAAKTIGIERNTTANQPGNSLTLQAGGATSGAADKAGGDLILSSGESTGYNTSNIYLQTATAQGPISSLACTITGINSTPPNGGSGYSLNDVLNVVETGAYGGIVKVTGVSGGVVTLLSFTLGQGGTGYTTGTQSTTGGMGSGCTVAITSVLPTPTNGGSNYAVNDVLAVTGGNGNGTVTVSSIDNNAVTSLNLTAAGTGYSTGTKTTTGGTGTGCTITITSVSSGVITGIAFSSPMGGSGYSVNDVLSIVDGSASGGQVKVLSTANGVVKSISLTSGGTGYKVTGAGNLTSPVAVGCKVNITVTGAILSATINAGGSGYAAGNVLTVAGGTGGQVQVDTVDGSGKVLTLHLVSGGSGYTDGTGIATTGGSGSGCTVNISVIGAITGVTLNTGGSGYQMNDVLNVIQTGASGGQVQVTGVTGGAVTSLSLVTGGSNYTKGNGYATAMACSGCTINIATITGTQYNAPSTKMAVLGNGNTGLGVTNPVGLLQLGSSSSSSYIVAPAPTGNATTDTANIRNAIAATCYAGYAGTVCLQANGAEGGYVVNDTISLSYISGLKLIGAGIGRTTIKMDSGAAKAVFYLEGGNGVTIKDMNLDSVQTTQVHTGIQFSNTSGDSTCHIVENVQIRNMSNGIFLTGYDNVFKNITMSNCITGVQAGDPIDSNKWANANKFFGGQINNSTSCGVRFSRGSANVLYGVDLSGNNVNDGAVSFDSGNNSLIGCYLEQGGSATAAPIRIASQYNRIMGCYIGSTPTAGYINWVSGSGPTDANVVLGNLITNPGPIPQEVILSNLGIGTTNPECILDINVPNTGTQTMLAFSNSGGGYADVARFDYDSVNSPFPLKFILNNRPLAIMGEGNIGNPGRVGIGATNKLSKFTVVGAADFTAFGWVSKTSGQNTLTGSATRFLQEVGIGDRISVPGGAVEVKTVIAITDDTHLTVDSNWTNTASSQLATVKPSTFRVEDDTNAVQMVIKDDGNVGMGTTSPAQKLHVAGHQLIQGPDGYDSTGEEAILYLGDTNQQVKAKFNNGLNFQTYNDPQNAFRWNNSGGTELMTLKGDTGRLGISCTNPGDKFSVGNKVLITDTSSAGSITVPTGGVTIFWDGTNLYAKRQSDGKKSKLTATWGP